MEKASILEMIQNNLAVFLLGWVFGAGLFPMLWEQLTAAL